MNSKNQPPCFESKTVAEETCNASVLDDSFYRHILDGPKNNHPYLTWRRVKYLFVTLVILLCAIAMMGLASGRLFSPEHKNNFLHEHLNAISPIAEPLWEETDFALPKQDKRKILQIVTDTDKKSLSAANKRFLTGQALRSAQEKICTKQEKMCDVAIRLNRSFKVINGNNDLRVVNIKETALRVTVEMGTDGKDIKFNGLADETRLLRFYKTQTGWMQKLSQVMFIRMPVFNDRKNKFKEKFSQKYLGVNYYPASASWGDFWRNFPLEIIERDLQRIKKLNANSIRIFLTHDYFENNESRDEALSKLTIFLNLCDDYNIKVLVTLFDLRPNYDFKNLQADINHMNLILPTLISHKALLGVDIKNQADLDFKVWGQNHVETWLTIMIRHLQMQFPDVAVTVGWSKAQTATGLKDIVDFVTYHEYENPKYFVDRLNEIKKTINGKPVMITELGSTVWTPFSSKYKAETKQAKRLAMQLKQSDQAQGVFVWTLHDFDHVGREVVGALPWRQAQQKHFGLIRADGTARPAATIFAQYRVHQNSTQSLSNLAILP